MTVFLTDLLGGGAERAMLDLATGIARRGWGVDLVLATARGPYLADVTDDVRLLDLNVGCVSRAIVPLAAFLRRERPDVLFTTLHHTNLMYYTYVGLRLASEDGPDADAYLSQSLRLTDGVFGVPYRPWSQPGGFIPTDTPLGYAVVYSFGAPGSTDVPDVHLEACPVTHAWYMLASVPNLHLDAVPSWDAEIMERLATGLAYFVLDTEQLESRSEPFAAGVSGDRTVDMLPPSEHQERVTVARITSSTFATYAAEDASGRLMQPMLEVHELFEGDPNTPESVDLPAAMLLVARVADAGRTW